MLKFEIADIIILIILLVLLYYEMIDIPIFIAFGFIMCINNYVLHKFGHCFDGTYYLANISVVLLFAFIIRRRVKKQYNIESFAGIAEVKNLGTFEALRKESPISKTFEDDLFKDLIYYENDESIKMIEGGETLGRMGLDKCLENCKGQCLEYGQTGVAWCFPASSMYQMPVEDLQIPSRLSNQNQDVKENSLNFVAMR
jgi:hypothetical protein